MQVSPPVVVYKVHMQQEYFRVKKLHIATGTPGIPKENNKTGDEINTNSDC